jgi:hypothetical protein
MLGWMRSLQRHAVWLALLLSLAPAPWAPNAFAQPAVQGAEGGQLQTFTVPEKGVLIGIVVYSDAARINGISFVYRTDRDIGSTGTISPTYGAARGTSKTIQVIRTLPIKSGELTWNDGLASIKLEWDGQVGAPEVAGVAGAQKAQLSFPASSEISGARIRADADRVYAVAFDTRPRQFPGVTIAKPDSNPASAPASAGEQWEFAGAEPEFRFGGTWQTANGAAGRVTLVPENVEGQAVDLNAAKDRNCLECGTYNTPAVIRIMPVDPAGRQIRVRFDKYPGLEAILTRQAEEMKTKDGNQGPTWMVPGGGTTAIFYTFDSDLSASKKASAASNANVNWRLELTTPATHFVAGTGSNRWTYQRPPWMQTDLEAAKREVRNTNLVAAKEGNNNQFTINATIAYGYILNGYDGVTVDIMTPDSGLRDPVFRDPDPDQWDINRYLADPKVIPRGIIALNRIQHGARYSETAISSQSEAHHELGYNFGLEGGPTGGSLGANFSISQSSGLTKSNETMMAFGVSRSYVYALVADKSNLQLSNAFKSYVLDYLMKLRVTDAESRTQSDAKYDEFINTFGTHYANAVTYGGAGIATTSFSVDSYVSWRNQSYSVGANGGAGAEKGPSAKLTGGYNESEGSSQSSLVSFKDEQFEAVGGVAGVNAHSWSVQMHTAIPVLYDLRPISQLISGLWFDQPDAVLLDIRRNVDAAIARRMATLPAPSTKSNRPSAYRLESVGLYCTAAGADEDKNDNTIELRGRGIISYADDRGGGNFDAFSATEPVSILCDNKTAYPISRTAVLWDKAGGASSPTVMFDGSRMVEIDYNPLDVYDLMSNTTTGGFVLPTWPSRIAAAPAWTPGEFILTGAVVHRTFNDDFGVPSIRLTYRIQKIE